MQIIPAILPKDFEEIETKLAYIKGVARHVQIDICDGNFVPSRTWPYGEKGVDEKFQKILDQEEGMPFWGDFDFEFDLMVKEPYAKIPDFITLGASRIVIHLLSADDEELLGIIKDYGKDSEALAPFDIEIGLCVTSESDKERIKKFVSGFHFIQVMGIKNVGYQHQALDEASIEMVKTMRREYSEMTISVDGAVTLDDAPLFIEAGADRLVVGSAIFGSENPEESFRQFQEL